MLVLVAHCSIIIFGGAKHFYKKKAQFISHLFKKGYFTFHHGVYYTMLYVVLCDDGMPH